MPTTDKYGQGVQIASLADPPNAETLASNIANAIVERSAMRFASASTRNATLTAPVAGMQAWLNDTKQLTVYDGTQWLIAVTATAGMQSWTPTWSTDTGQHLPVFGNADVRCKFMQLGPAVFFNMWIEFGSTTSFGAGVTTGDNWRFSLPKAPNVTSITVGTCHLFVGSLTRAVSGPALINSSGFLNLYIGSGPSNGNVANGGVVDSLSPFTWGSGDRLSVVGQYEAV